MDTTFKYRYGSKKYSTHDHKIVKRRIRYSPFRKIPRLAVTLSICVLFFYFQKDLNPLWAQKCQVDFTSFQDEYKANMSSWTSNKKYTAIDSFFQHYDEALSHCDQFSKVFAEKYVYPRAYIYFENLNRKQEALQYLQHYLDDAAIRQKDSVLVYISITKALLHIRVNEWQQMKNCLTSAIELGKNIYPDENNDLFRARINLVNYYEWMDQLDDGLQLSLFLDSVSTAHQYPNPRYTIINRQHMMGIYNKQNEPEKAEKILEGLIVFNEKYNGNNLAFRNSLLEDRFQMLVRKKDYLQADSLFNQHLGYLLTMNHPSYDLMLNYAKVLAHQNKKEEAAVILERVRKSLSDRNIPSLHLYWVRYHLMMLSLLDHDPNTTNEIISKVNHALQLNLDLAKTEPEHKQGPTLRMLEGYIDQLITIDERINHPLLDQTIFECVAILKSFSYRYYSERRLLTANNPVYLEKYAELEAAKRKVLATFYEMDSLGQQKLNLDFLALADLESKFISSISSSFDLQPFNIELRSIQDRLADGALLIQYYFDNRGGMHIFTIGQDSFAHISQSIDPALLPQPIQLSKVNYLNNKRENKKLYQSFLQPIWSKIERSAELILLLDGPLEYVNFDAILCGDKAGTSLGDYRRTKHFDNVISFLQGSHPHDAIPANGQKLYAIGGLKYACPVDQSLTSEPNTNLRNEELAYLPGSSIEILRLKNLFSTQNSIRIDSACSVGKEQFFESITGFQPHWLHIATHGFYTKKKSLSTQSQYAYYVHSLSSGLALSNAKYDRSDGIVTNLDLCSKDLSALDLVFISGCDTGVGAIYDAQGNFSIAKGFKNAGVRSVVYSLWKVQDQVMAPFVEAFYSYMKQGMGPRTALQSTRNTFKNKMDKASLYAFQILE